jgi:hypothetical protein
VRNSFEAGANAPDENLPTPDCAVVAVTRAVKTHSNDARIPSASFGKDGRNVSPMMLREDFFG